MWKVEPVMTLNSVTRYIITNSGNVLSIVGDDRRTAALHFEHIEEAQDVADALNQFSIR